MKLVDMSREQLALECARLRGQVKALEEILEAYRASLKARQPESEEGR